jgi:hypothetical protein
MRKLLIILLFLFINISAFSQNQVGETDSPIYYKNGKVGLGTSNPQYGKLEITGEGEAEGICIYKASGSTFRMYRTGDVGYLTRGGDNNRGLSITSPGFVGLGYVNDIPFQMAISNGLLLGPNHGTRVGTLQINASGAEQGITLWTESGEMTSRLWIDASKDLLYLTKGATSTNGLCIARNGNIGMGTEDTGANRLSVNGTIRAKEIKVETDWADFVFEDDYQLMKLSDLEEFIQENGHLPEIPTEKEVEENGVSLGEMNSKLLQKIEELTLYTIQLQKENKNLQKQQNDQLKQINAQQQIIENLQKLEERLSRLEDLK